MKVSPTKAVAIPETSSSTRTRSTASRTIAQVVERELDPLLQDLRGRNERGVRRVGAGDDRADVAKNGEVGDGDDVHPRVAAGIAVRAELRQQAGDVDAGLLGELAPRRRVQRLVRPLEAARRRPHPLERRLASPDEQSLEQPFGHRQDHDVDRHGERREGARVVAGGAAGYRRHDSYIYTVVRVMSTKTGAVG